MKVAFFFPVALFPTKHTSFHVLETSAQVSLWLKMSPAQEAHLEADLVPWICLEVQGQRLLAVLSGTIVQMLCQYIVHSRKDWFVTNLRARTGLYLCPKEGYFWVTDIRKHAVTVLELGIPVH